MTDSPAQIPFRVERLDHLVLRARDLDRLTAFYRDVLGCQLERELEELGLVQLRAGASLIDLISTSGETGTTSTTARSRPSTAPRASARPSTSKTPKATPSS